MVGLACVVSGMTLSSSASPLVITIMGGTPGEGQALVVDGGVSGAVELYAPSVKEDMTVLSWSLQTVDGPSMPGQHYSGAHQEGSTSASAHASGTEENMGVSLYFTSVVPEGIMHLGIDVMRRAPTGPWLMTWYEVQEHLTDSGISLYGWGGGSVRAVSIGDDPDNTPPGIATPEPPVFATALGGVGMLVLLCRVGAARSIAIANHRPQR